MYCTNCGAELTEGAKFCTSCGAQVAGGNQAEGADNDRNMGKAVTGLESNLVTAHEINNNSRKEDAMYCRNCGTELKPGNSFCPSCGQKIADDLKQPSQPVNEQKTVQTSNNEKELSGKKKKKLPLILLVAAIAVVGIILAVTLSSGGMTEEEKIALCKSQTPFVDDGKSQTIDNAFSSYFGNGGSWYVTEKADHLGYDLSGADVVYFASMPKTDFDINDSVVNFVRNKGLEVTDDGVLLCFGFNVSGKDVSYPFLVVDTLNNGNIKIAEDGAKSTMFQVFTLADSGVTAMNSMYEERMSTQGERNDTDAESEVIQEDQSDVSEKQVDVPEDQSDLSEDTENVNNEDNASEELGSPFEKYQGNYITDDSSYSAAVEMYMRENDDRSGIIYFFDDLNGYQDNISIWYDSEMSVEGTSDVFTGSSESDPYSHYMFTFYYGTDGTLFMEVADITTGPICTLTWLSSIDE